MKLKNNLLNIILILGLSFLLLNCGSNEDKYPQSYDFSPSFDSPRKVFKTYKEDLDKDGKFEFVILSVVKDESDTTARFFNFDQIELYHWIGKENNYEKILVDSVYFGSGILFDDVDKDGKSEIVLKTNSGGEDSVNTVGLKCYRIVDKHKSIKIFDSEVGSPVFTDLDNDGPLEIMSYRVLYNKLSGIKRIVYLNRIYRLNQEGIYIESTQYYSGYIHNYISQDSSVYYKIKNIAGANKTLDQVSLFTSFIKIILENNLINESIKNTMLWDSEKEYLRSSLKREQFFDLVNILQHENMEITEELKAVSESLVQTAEDFFKKKDFKNTIKIYEELLNIFPDNYDAYVRLGETYFLIKNYDESINYYLQAMLFSVNDKQLYLGLGRSFKGIGDFKQSRIYFNKYLQFDSTSAEALEIKAILKLKEMQ